MLSPKLLLLSGFQILGLFWFLRGFFPRKATLSGFSSFDYSSSPFATDTGAQFEKLIVVVVDALRSDFMFSMEDSSMPFLHSLIREGNALPYTAFSHPPTVTLPRLKGITTGGTPSFIDAILNIADDKDQSQGLEMVDSWIYQFKHRKNGRIMHFFGDDTWLKLFPPASFFERFEGTHSFFVSDFTEVDCNVTRHLQTEISDTSWDALILHYLGLDHIGHSGGPQSVYMKPKQAEMDDVLKQLYMSRVSNTNDTLLVLLGDHGMNDIGNHGGASAGETSPGLVFASPKFSLLKKDLQSPLMRDRNYKYYSQMSQIDLVPTLSALFNFPIPKNNLGILVPEILDLWPSGLQKRSALLENCKQFMNVLAEKYDKGNSAYVSFLDEYRSLSNNGTEAIDSYFSFLKKIQSSLIEESTNYSYFDISCGFCMIVVSTLSSWLFLYGSLREKCASAYGIQLFFAIFCVVYSLHFHGSSLIEEEHQLWWFLTVAVLSVHLAYSRVSVAGWFTLTLFGFRLIRAWNDSGQKYVSNYTISKVLVSSPGFNWLLVLATYIFIIVQISRQGPLNGSSERSSSNFQTSCISKFLSLIPHVLISLLSFAFKLSQFAIDGNEIPQWLRFFHSFSSEIFSKDDLNGKKGLQSMNVSICRFFFGGFAIVLASHIVVGKLRGHKLVLVKELVGLSTLLLIHQTRVETVPIFMIFNLLKTTYSELLSGVICESNIKVVLLTLFTLCAQNLSFFSVGNTNSLATVDLANAYNGMSEYNVLVVGILTFVSNFAVVIYWSLASTELLATEIIKLKPSASMESLTNFRTCLSQAFYAVSTLSLISSCINLRFHLFIWSVFSPKLLYFSVWVVLVNFVFDSLLGSLSLCV